MINRHRDPYSLCVVVIFVWYPTGCAAMILCREWILLCRETGIKYLEIAHLFTQWGAQHAPKIIAEVEGKSQCIFGWETQATGIQYCDFLKQFIPELLKVLEAENILEDTYFHVSDEPDIQHYQSYKEAKADSNNTSNLVRKSQSRRENRR